MRSELLIAFTGSGAKPLAEAAGVPFVQEVVANSLAVARYYPDAGTAIELGGQDAKIIFFRKDMQTGKLQVSDMRMNGSCAGGTGAFIDEIASLLKVSPEDYESLAEKGKTVHDISGRCGVFAKTDIQPLLNQGVSREDIALSALYAIVKQTIGGLAQGLAIEKPVVFEGGPLCFHPTLVQAFCEKLSLDKDDVLFPEKPELMVAMGAALYAAHKEETLDIDICINRLRQYHEMTQTKAGKRFFNSESEYRDFVERHKIERTDGDNDKTAGKGHFHTDFSENTETVEGYLGIDCGSTTTKFVLTDRQDKLVYSYYSSNGGNPVTVIKNALIEMEKDFRQRNIKLQIKGAATTGYGEMLAWRALRADMHLVETVAHAKASEEYEKDATFILDIGGQDMKAIWLKSGIITNIVVNEACSAGCGSFLENFAKTMGVLPEEIAEKAFLSEHPAELGSRCTVFMNSSIITEQKNGKNVNDILAGLCRSVIENVFTKVIRITDKDSLGDRIVVQGGTFCNDAVLRALEQYLGKEVIRAPYPGLMGAIGAAKAVKEKMEKSGGETSFIGFEALRNLTFEQKSGVVCNGCENHCRRSVVSFSTGDMWITGNRCEKGSEFLGKKQEVRKKGINLFQVRKNLLLREYPYQVIGQKQNVTIGIPLVLSFWELLPFWTTFWKSLGFSVLLSPESKRVIYESGRSAVTSDTECFPAKLVHGHIRWLEDNGADRIFMPSITSMHTENREKTSESMCAIVKGYPIVIKNSDNPEERGNAILDAPLFHWHTDKDRDHQMIRYMEETFGIEEKITEKALRVADAAQEMFHQELKESGRKTLEQLRKNGQFGIVLAARPYQNDSLVNHHIPEMHTEMGISVIPADSIPKLSETDLSRSRLDIVNNYHARMLASAIYAAQHKELEYVQLVSFGCGHDAYLSDEIIRMMKEVSGKTPLILKIDESDATGPLSIRIRSFVSTVQMQRERKLEKKVRELPEPYQRKFEKEDKEEYIVFVPNTSHAFCRIMSAALETQHIRTVPLPVGREKAIRLGKKYVHNDICFPAQIVIGEALEALGSEEYAGKKKAIAMGKYIGCCRLTHYSALLRKALDDAGYEDVPILTNDEEDYHHLHPGFKMNLFTSLKMAFALPMVDALEGLLRKIRPYEKEEGSADRAFELAMDDVVNAVRKGGILYVKKCFKKAIRRMQSVAYDRTVQRPEVLIVGEYLLNFHPGANHEIERYLEQNGFEIIEAKMSDVIQKTYFYQMAQIAEYKIKKKFSEKLYLQTVNQLFDIAHHFTESVAKKHPLYEPAKKLKEIVKLSDPVMHHTFDSGEGVLIPAEIIEHAGEGCKAFVILQPFGCIPNHVVGRGVCKKIKKMFPDIQILPLDYDPDVSFANVENRLQMLVMNAQNGISA